MDLKQLWGKIKEALISALPITAIVYTLLEIAFDQLGTKKLMAKTASAHMRKLQ